MKPGELRAIAKIFPAFAAIAALAASPAQPRHAEALPGPDTSDVASHFFGYRHCLVPRDNREARVGQFAVYEVQVGAANAAGKNAAPYLACGRRRQVQCFGTQAAARTAENHRAHGAIVA